jgi:hypothetical protein
MRALFEDRFAFVSGKRINQVVESSGSRLRPDLFLPNYGGRRVLFDVGSSSKAREILKYRALADELIPLIPNSWIR